MAKRSKMLFVKPLPFDVIKHRLKSYRTYTSKTPTYRLHPYFSRQSTLIDVLMCIHGTKWCVPSSHVATHGDTCINGTNARLIGGPGPDNPSFINEFFVRPIEIHIESREVRQVGRKKFFCRNSSMSIYRRVCVTKGRLEFEFSGICNEIETPDLQYIYIYVQTFR